MNLELFTSIVGGLLDKASHYPATVVGQMKALMRNLTGIVPIEIDETSISSSNWTEDGIQIDEIVVPANIGTGLFKIAKLHDDSFVLLYTGGPSLHVNANFSVISHLPFKVGDIDDGPDISNYTDPINICAIPYTVVEDNVEINGTIVGLVLEDSHVVQLYKWQADRWTFFCTIGTANSGADSTDHLESPQAAVGYHDIANDVVVVLVSHLGDALHGIKRWEITLGGSVTDKGTISTTSDAFGGYLQYSETSIVAEMELDPSLASVWLNNTVGEISEFGKMEIDLENNVLVAELSKKGPIEILSDVGDTILTPSAIAIGPDKIFVGDANGHITVLVPDLSSILYHVGKLKIEDTSYPLEFGIIDDLLVTGDVLYIVSDERLYSSNLSAIQAQSVVYKILGPSVNFKIEKIIGLNSSTAIDISVDDGVSFFPISYFSTRTVASGSSILIRMTKSIGEIIKGHEALQEGLLLVSI